MKPRRIPIKPCNKYASLCKSILNEQGRARAFAALLSAKLSSDRIQQYTEPKVTAQQLQQIARDQKITIVSYSLISPQVIGADSPSRGNSQLYVWVISPNGEISFRDLDLYTWEIANGKSLITTIQKLQERLASASGTTRIPNKKPPLPQFDESPEELLPLYQLLIKPIEQFLPTDTEAKVVFVPHDALFLVPFAALRDSSKKYLIDKHTISYSPSIQLLESTSDLAPFLKESSRNGFENNFKTITSSNISINLDVSEKFQPKNRSE